MEKKLVVKFLIGFLFLQRNIIGTNEMPSALFEKDALVNKEDRSSLTSKANVESQTKLQNDHKEVLLDAKSGHNNSSEKTHLRPGHWEGQIQARVMTSSSRVYGHNPSDILFMITSLFLVLFHLFFMDMFVRLTRPRFQNSTRYQYVSTIHLFLCFTVSAVDILLILLHYRDSEYCF